MSTQAQPGPLAGAVMLHALADHWWVLLIRGIAAIVFGVLTFLWPGITLLTLTMFWGAFALVDGVLALWSAISGKMGPVAPRWWLAIVGVAGIAAGILTFVWPVKTAIILLLFIACWAIVAGVMEIWGAIKLRKEIENEWLLGLAGLMTVIFGVILIARPMVGALAVAWIIGWFAMLLGVTWIALAFRLKKHKRTA
jgi:uncharacterized membrane protein HdeD (DUF308 family)